MNLFPASGVAVVSLVGLALVGCTTPEAESEATEADLAGTAAMVTYQCPDGELIEAEYRDEDAEVVVGLPNQEPIALPQVEAASGAKYSDGTTTFWSKGNQVLVEVDGETILSDCIAQ